MWTNKEVYFISYLILKIFFNWLLELNYLSSISLIGLFRFFILIVKNLKIFFNFFLISWLNFFIYFKNNWNLLIKFEFLNQTIQSCHV